MLVLLASEQPPGDGQRRGVHAELSETEEVLAQIFDKVAARWKLETRQPEKSTSSIARDRVDPLCEHRSIASEERLILYRRQIDHLVEPALLQPCRQLFKLEAAGLDVVPNVPIELGDLGRPVLEQRVEDQLLQVANRRGRVSACEGREETYVYN